MAEPGSDPFSGVANVTAPTSGGPWEQYRLTVCETAAPQTCLQSMPLCDITAGVDPTECPIPGASPFTEYSVVAVALKANGTSGTIESLPSNTDTFRTLIQ